MIWFTQISSIYHVIILQVKIQGQRDTCTCKMAQPLSTLVLKACPEFDPQNHVKVKRIEKLSSDL